MNYTTTIIFSRFGRYLLAIALLLSGISKCFYLPGLSTEVSQYCELYVSSFSRQIAIVVCCIEVLLGLLLFFERSTLFSTFALFTLMLFFLCLTGKNYFFPTMLGRIELCGCFGELIHFSAKGSFIKTLVLCVISFATFCLVIKRKIFSVAFVLIILPMVVSCNSRDKIGKEMKAFYGSHIELPTDSMINVSTRPQAEMYKYARCIYIMYVDSTSCSDCAISKLADWSQLNLTVAFRKGILRYMLIVSPKQHQRIHVLNIIKGDSLFNKYVYIDIDTTGIFERKNPNLPTNKLLHTFLVNKQKYVELIGNLMANEKIKNMLTKILDNNQKEGRMH